MWLFLCIRPLWFLLLYIHCVYFFDTISIYLSKKKGVQQTLVHLDDDIGFPTTKHFLSPMFLLLVFVVNLYVNDLVTVEDLGLILSL